MLIDLVQVTTRDGVRLDGMYQSPSQPGPFGIAVDACCLVHGTGGSFYSSTLFDAVAERMLGLGCAVLRVNTRGHDVMSNAVTTAGGRRLGAAYEVVDECRHDLAAWLGWLKDRAGPRLVLIGHSLGAVKCMYALAHEPQSLARGVVAISPPRLSYAWFCASPEGAAFLETFAHAERQVTEGRPGTLLDVKLPLPFVVTAAGYVEKYGPHERYNYLDFAARMPCPVLVTLGAVECTHNMAFRGVSEALVEVAAHHPGLAVTVIPEADHFYSGVRSDLVGRVEAWLRTTFR